MEILNLGRLPYTLELTKMEDVLRKLFFSQSLDGSQQAKTTQD